MTKEKANDINEAVIKGKQTEQGINQTREIYRIVATESSLIYFLMLELYNIDHMYQYSLDSFQFFFLKALRYNPNSTIHTVTDNSSPMNRSGDRHGIFTHSMSILSPTVASPNPVNSANSLINNINSSDSNNSNNPNSVDVSSASNGVRTASVVSPHAAASHSNKLYRVGNLQNILRWTIFKWVTRGLFDKHRLIFLTQLTMNLLECQIDNHSALTSTNSSSSSSSNNANSNNSVSSSALNSHVDDYGYTRLGFKFLLLGSRIQSTLHSGGTTGLEYASILY